MINSSTSSHTTVPTVPYTTVLQFNMNFIVIADYGYIAPFNYSFII